MNIKNNQVFIILAGYYNNHYCIIYKEKQNEFFVVKSIKIHNFHPIINNVSIKINENNILKLIKYKKSIWYKLLLDNYQNLKLTQEKKRRKDEKLKLVKIYMINRRNNIDVLKLVKITNKNYQN